MPKTHSEDGGASQRRTYLGRSSLERQGSARERGASFVRKEIACARAPVGARAQQVEGTESSVVWRQTGHAVTGTSSRCDTSVTPHTQDCLGASEMFTGSARRQYGGVSGDSIA